GGEKRGKPADKPGSVVGSHSSRSCVAAGLERPTRERRGPRHGSPIRSCSRWGLPCRSVARLAVRSYRTVSPLPDPLAGPSAVCFLLHCPSACAAQALPGTLPCGARTFLGARTRRGCLAGFLPECSRELGMPNREWFKQQRLLFPIPHSPFPIPHSPFPIPHSQDRT